LQLIANLFVAAILRIKNMCEINVSALANLLIFFCLLQGKVQKLKDRQFGKVQLFVPHKNPQAIIGNILLINVKEVESFRFCLACRICSFSGYWSPYRTGTFLAFTYYF
jgi:hypothetical protein